MKTKACLFSFIFFVFLFYIILISTTGAATKIMPLGDSITNGNSSGVVPDKSAYYVSYRKALLDKLLAAGYDIDFVGSLNSGSAIFGALGPADHEGHPGWRDDQILNGRPAEPEKGNLAVWLADEKPEIVLLHIGTNGVNPNPDHVEAILDEIDAFESANSLTIWVVLALIINRSCSIDVPPCPESVTTTNFNDNVQGMALDRINNPANPAFPDKIVIVDMEAGAGIDYRLQPVGNMANNLHPFDTGYKKMADLWFTGLKVILPPILLPPTGLRIVP